MEDTQEHFMEQEEFDGSNKPSSSPYTSPFRSTRLHIQRSNVCSRAYFVVVMVFFHVYILNVIALLLYVHYNNGPGDLVSGDGASASLSENGSPLLECVLTFAIVVFFLFLSEIPGFLSEEECRVVVQLAQLKGLMETKTSAASQGQEESYQPVLSLSAEEVFSLLDLNQDGLLQRQEIVSHSHSRDGTWLSPDNLRQILTGLEACPTGLCSCLRTGMLWSQFKQRSKHTWLYQGLGSHYVLNTLRTRVISLTRLPSSLVELSEPLQVIRYEHGDFSNAHYDSSPSHPDTSCAHTRLAANTSALTEVSCRYLTVLFYLSSVEEGGETSFPVADNRTYEEQVSDGVDLTDTQETCDRGNLRIKPTVGTALLWYNHLSDGRGWMGELDEYSLHGDCPVGHRVKWVANNWVNVDPDHQIQAHYQRLVTQRHRAKSNMEEHYQPLSHSDLHQDL
uniref:Fe2OG dioxygenase domain-containing protein n=1 Tax=Monopterus albus TaxID=43700 RepID=A0A3Q3JL84_MONAL